MSAIKRLGLRILTNPVILRGVEQTTRGAATILTMHRFAGYGRTGHDTGLLARNLEWLRARRYRVLSVMDLIDRVRAGMPLPPRTVVFTVDDGYADFAEFAAPVFARYDCPVTVFLVTGFVDGGRWLWWDRVRHAVEHTTLGGVELQLLPGAGPYSWTDMTGRVRASRDLIRRIRKLPNSDREAVLTDLETRLGIPAGATVPREFASMTWDQVRTLARSGVAFGPHTVTHPFLAGASTQESRREILGSWARLREQTDAAIPVFCWPYGDPESFGEREAGFAAEAGVVAALSTVQRSVTGRMWRTNSSRYALPRYAYMQDATSFAQVVSGLERLKEIARSMGRGNGPRTVRMGRPASGA